MKRIFAASMTVAAVSFASLEAVAQERVGDAALGALSGAVFFGPVGAVAGAMVGYTTGPSIAHAWGMQRHRPYHHARSKHPASHGTKKAAASTKASAQAARASTVRPVQALE
ncbi:MAG: DNA-directed RNA polymerase subunit N [Xanthobacteraceae bacterium]